ncbi:MAG: hypothetical protein COV45_02090 [Deltaproteobacteria bacterium CG11_big_fil_rev_8_21_14_0_20_47_16]|nr:MAG: hypothetical protein COV45_02090 [Deltaproteobacteria bacterium CG11_big_fil_rev_8_21_14_0_20_47_16]
MLKHTALIIAFSMLTACGSYSSGGGSTNTTSYTLTETTITGAFTSVTMTFTVATPTNPDLTVAELETDLTNAVSAIYCGGNTSPGSSYYTPTNAEVSITNATGTLTANTFLTMPTTVGCVLVLTTPASDAGWTFQDTTGTTTYEFSFSNN